MLLVSFRAPALGQPSPSASIRITVADPSGAVIVGAQVTIRPGVDGAAPVTIESGGRGDAIFAALEPGRYSVHVEAAGFEPYDIRDLRIRSGETRREAKLRIAKLAETIEVGRNPQERASDPRSDAFATILNQAQIDELPDDPDEMEQVLRDMAGPGATLRVNGFRGGKLPPKNQIQQIRFRRNLFAASSHEPGFISVDIITKPGLDGWRGATNAGFRDAALNTRNAFAPVKGDERHERVGLSVSGPVWKQHTSMAISLDGIDAFDTKTIVAATSSGYFADSIRKPNDALNLSARLEHARAYSQTRTENVLRASLTGAIRKSLFNELRLQWRGDDMGFVPASTAPAIVVLNAFNSGGAQMSGQRRVNEIQLTNDLDIAVGHHAIRAGLQLDNGRSHTNILRNGGGTFTFSSLAAYNAGAPTTFTRNVGNPELTISQAEEGAYIEDDVRGVGCNDSKLSAGSREFLDFCE